MSTHEIINIIHAFNQNRGKKHTSMNTKEDYPHPSFLSKQLVLSITVTCLHTAPSDKDIFFLSKQSVSYLLNLLYQQQIQF